MPVPKPVEQRLLNIGPAAWFRPEPLPTPANQVVVKIGNAQTGGFQIFDRITGGDQFSAGFSVVLAGQRRFDLVYIDASGIVQVQPGTALALATPDFEGAPGWRQGGTDGPDLPDQAVPVAWVKITEPATVIVDVTDIFQINGFVRISRDLDGFRIDKGAFIAQGIVVPAGVTSTDVSAAFVGETPGGTSSQRGVITVASENFVDIVDQDANELKLASDGSQVFGRLTEAAGTWTMAYLALVGGIEVAVTVPAQIEGPAPTDIRMIGVRKVFSRNEPSRPLFADSVSRLSDLAAADIPVGTNLVQGKLKIESDGATTAADLALGTTDARAGATKGRANAGAISGFQQIVRIVQSTGISVSLLESGGELRFTITNTAPGGAAPAPGGFGFAWSGVGNSGALGFTPIGAFATGNSDGLFTTQGGGAVGTVATEQAWLAVNTVAPGTTRGTGGILAGSPVTAWSAANVQISGGNGQCLIWGL